MATKELVLRLGIEGGGACIYRTAIDADVHRFHVEGVGMSLDNRDEECWHQWTTIPVSTIEEALESIACDGGWISWHPLMILHECRGSVLRGVQKTQLSVATDVNESWHRMRVKWLELCSSD